jgi:protein-disulfide isomerase
MSRAQHARFQHHILGPSNAQVLVVCYADYECPHSKLAYRALKELAEWHGNLIGIAFRHFPLSDIHPQARSAAAAAEAAHNQGLFWEMSELMFQRQQLLDRQHLVRYAASLGMEMPRFEADLDQDAHRDRIERDIASGVALGLWSTPTLFLNGVIIDGDEESIIDAVGEAVCSGNLFVVR